MNAIYVVLGLFKMHDLNVASDNLFQKIKRKFKHFCACILYINTANRGIL